MVLIDFSIFQFALVFQLLRTCIVDGTILNSWHRQLQAVLSYSSLCLNQHDFTLYYTRVHLRQRNVVWRRNSHQSTYLAKTQTVLKADGCKPWVTNLSIVPYTLGILTANVNCCLSL